MAQRRFHYDQAFEQYLRHHTIPYVAVDEAKRALGTGPKPRPMIWPTPIGDTSLKSFDFVVYNPEGPNLIVDVKGRKHTGRSNRSLDNWVTQADVDSLGRWERIFGYDFEAIFAFLFWCQQPPPDSLFQDVFESGGRSYAVLAIKLAGYRFYARSRSPRWRTVSMPAAQFTQHAVPLSQLLRGSGVPRT